MRTEYISLRDKAAVQAAEESGRLVVVDRTTKWGNPFIIGRDGSRKEVIQKYRAWIVRQEGLLHDLPELKGKVLGCWCWPQACHSQVLISLVESDSGSDAA